LRGFPLTISHLGYSTISTNTVAVIDRVTKKKFFMIYTNKTRELNDIFPTRFAAIFDVPFTLPSLSTNSTPSISSLLLIAITLQMFALAE
jgi:hypothetical protein